MALYPAWGKVGTPVLLSKPGGTLPLRARRKRQTRRQRYAIMKQSTHAIVCPWQETRR